MKYLLEVPIPHQLANSNYLLLKIQSIEDKVYQWAIDHEHRTELQKIKFKIFLNSLEISFPSNTWYTQWILTVPETKMKYKVVGYPSLIDRIKNVIRS